MNDLVRDLNNLYETINSRGTEEVIDTYFDMLSRLASLEPSPSPSPSSTLISQQSALFLRCLMEQVLTQNEAARIILIYHGLGLLALILPHIDVHPVETHKVLEQLCSVVPGREMLLMVINEFQGDMTTISTRCKAELIFITKRVSTSLPSKQRVLFFEQALPGLLRIITGVDLEKSPGENLVIVEAVGLCESLRGADIALLLVPFALRLLSLFIFDISKDLCLVQRIMCVVTNLSQTPFNILQKKISEEIDKEECHYSEDEEIQKTKLMKWPASGVSSFVIFLLYHNIQREYLPSTLHPNYIFLLAISHTRIFLKNGNPKITPTIFDFIDFLTNSVEKYSLPHYLVDMAEFSGFISDFINCMMNTKNVQIRSYSFRILNNVISILDSEGRFHVLWGILMDCPFILFSSEVIHRCKQEFLEALSNNDPKSPFLHVPRLIDIFMVSLTNSLRQNLPEHLEMVIASLNFLLLFIIQSQEHRNKNILKIHPYHFKRIHSLIIEPWFDLTSRELDKISKSEIPFSENFDKKGLVAYGISTEILNRSNAFVAITSVLERIKELLPKYGLMETYNDTQIN